MSNIVFGITLKPDGFGNFTGQVTGASEAVKKFGQDAKTSNAQAAAAAEQFTSQLKRQADTLGMTRAQTLAYEGAQHRLTAAQRESAQQSILAIEAHDKNTAVLGRLRLAAIAAGSAIGVALVASLKSAVVQAAEEEQSHLRLAAVLRGTGYAAGLTKVDLDNMADSMKLRFGVDDNELRDSMAVLLTFKSVSRASFGEAMEVAANLAAVMKTDLSSAVMQLGKALENPDEGLSALARSGVSFSNAQKGMIKQMVDTGRQAEAITLILKIMKEQGLDGVAESMNQGITKATRDAGMAWDDLLKTIGSTSAIKGTTEAVFGSLAKYLDDMRRVINDGDWLDRLAFFTLGMTTPSMGKGKPNTASSAEADAAKQGLARQQEAQRQELLAIARQKEQEEAKKKAVKDAAARAAEAKKLAEDEQKRYASLVNASSDRIAVLNAEVSASEKLTESEKRLAVFQDNVLRGTSGLSKAHILSARAQLQAEVAAERASIKAVGDKKSALESAQKAQEAAKKHETDYANIIQKLEGNLTEAAAKHAGLNAEQAELAKMQASPIWEKLTEDQRGYITALLDGTSALNEQMRAEEADKKALEAANKAREDAIGFINQMNSSARQTLADLEFNASLQGKSALETARLTAARKAQLEIDQQILEINRQHKDNLPARDAAVSEIERARPGIINNAVAAANAQAIADAHEKEAQRAEQAWERFSENVQRNLGDELFKGLSGKFMDIGDMFKQMLLRMAADAAAAQIMIAGANLAKALFGLPGGTVGASPAGSPGSASGGGGFAAGSGAAAKGAWFTGESAHYYANGGAFSNRTFDQPTPFQFANGGGFNLGVMGEAGPEAVMPLTRGADGKLGVQAQGSGRPVNITYAPVIQIDSRSDRAQVERLVGEQIKQGNADLVDRLQREGVI